MALAFIVVNVSSMHELDIQFLGYFASDWESDVGMFALWPPARTLDPWTLQKFVQGFIIVNFYLEILNTKSTHVLLIILTCKS